MADKAGVHHADPPVAPDIVPFVVTESPPALAKVQTIWDQSVSKANAKHLGASTQFYNAPAALKAKLKDEILDLKPPVERLRSVPWRVNQQQSICQSKKSINLRN
jgi:hypothetical protein